MVSSNLDDWTTEDWYKLGYKLLKKAYAEDKNFQKLMDYVIDRSLVSPFESFETFLRCSANHDKDLEIFGQDDGNLTITWRDDRIEEHSSFLTKSYESETWRDRDDEEEAYMPEFTKELLIQDLKDELTSLGCNHEDFFICIDGHLPTSYSVSLTVPISDSNIYEDEYLLTLLRN